jgi:hypothetical protein
MSTKRSRTIVATVVGGIAISTFGAGSTAWAGGGATASSTAQRSVVTLPQRPAAHKAAAWLASQVNAKGYVTFSANPDVSDTALTVLALAAAGGERATALRALGYLRSHVGAYVTSGGHDGAGQLATLILDAHALGQSPTSFGGTNLVKRLLKTLRSTGPDAGLFGVQDPTYDGAYRQGLALAALSAAGVRATSGLAPAIAWLKRQQCANGGWESYRSSTTPACPASDPATYTGPDTNSTALAVEGLVAQRAKPRHNPVVFFRLLQSGDGGWGYYGGSSDPDSTALVIQALVSLRDSVSSTTFRKGTKDPASALLAFRLASGAFFYPTPGSPNTASGLATEQAVPALMSKAFPF